MFIKNQQQCGGRHAVQFCANKCLISRNTLTIVIWPHQRLDYLCKENVNEIRNLAQGTASQTIQSNGKMSVELIHLSYHVMIPMNIHFLFVPQEKPSFSWVEISLIHFFYFFIFLYFLCYQYQIGCKKKEPCRDF